jgi:hypothetical protein
MLQGRESITEEHLREPPQDASGERGRGGVGAAKGVGGEKGSGAAGGSSSRGSARVGPGLSLSLFLFLSPEAPLSHFLPLSPLSLPLPLQFSRV